MDDVEIKILKGVPGDVEMMNSNPKVILVTEQGYEAVKKAVALQDKVKELTATTAVKKAEKEAAKKKTNG